MEQKTKKVRHVQKHDTEAHWKQATGFSPLAGELIIYDADEHNPIPRFKIGNGTTNVNDLPFQPDRAIYDVTALPTENIDENNIYRLNVGHIYISGVKDPRFSCLIVDGLPITNQSQMIAATGDSMTDVTRGYCYYDLQTQKVYGYFTDSDALSYGVYHGWAPFENVYFWWSTRPWGGVIADTSLLPNDNKMYAVLEYELYWYKGAWFNLTDQIGRHGTGEGAEEFNHAENTANGNYSHAEGYGTLASGLAAHVEGHTSHAEGHAAHAEGELAYALGDSSHAEGVLTRATGHRAHAEGLETIAAGNEQHVQGKYNIEDTDNQYAHIVGNGNNAEQRSNAHTVDWDGNAWFAGSITSQSIIIEDDVGNQTTMATIMDPKPEDNGKILKAQDGKWIPAKEEAGSVDVVKYTEQTLTNEQQTQARKNIHAGQPILNTFGLPEQNFDSDTLYRMIDTIVYDYGDLLYKPTFIYVEELPNTGKPIINLNSDNDDFCFYYNNNNGLVYCYVDEILSAALGAEGLELQSGWYDYQEFLYVFGNPDFGIVILAVDTLPNSGMPSLMLDQDGIPYGDTWGYYNQADNEAYCYVDDNLSAFIQNQLGQSIPEGWYLLSQLAPMNNIDYQGIFTKEEDIPTEGVSILITNKLYSYNNRWEPIPKAQIQSDWNQDDDTQSDYIKNKPDIVQPDWNQNDDTQPDYIWNKPNVAQADWNIADEANPAAIKNKPFGMVKQIADVIPERTFTFSEIGSGDTIGDIGYSWPLFEEDIVYSVWLNGEYIGAARLGQHIPIFNGEFFFSNGGLGIYGGNYPSGQYTVRIAGLQLTTKKLDSQYLNLCTDVYDRTTYANPITGEAVFNVTAEYGIWQANLNDRIDQVIMPAIGPVPVKDDEDKILQVVGGKPTWVVQKNTEYQRINVRDYGTVGDGVTDDQPAIWAAWQAAKALILQDIPCELYFPAGTYGILNGGMRFAMPSGKGGLRITGAGRENTTIQYLTNWQPSSQYGGSIWYAIDVCPESNGVTGDYSTYIHDVAITGLTVYDPDPCAHAWHPDKGDSDKEENHGVNIGYCLRASVTECQFITVGDEAIDIFSCNDVVVMNNHLEGCPGAGSSGGAIAICDGCDGVVVTNNTINGSALDETLDNGKIIEKSNFGIAVESLGIPVRNVIIANNIIRNIQGTGINLGATGGAGADSGMYNISVKGNIIQGCNDGIGDEGTYPKVNVTIDNNIITDCTKLRGGFGRGFALVDGGFTTLSIRGNTIRNTDAFGAYMRGVDILIEGNVFENIGAEALYIVNSATIRDCTIKNTGLSETKGNGAIGCYEGAVYRVYGCKLTDVHQTKGIFGATEVESTIIEMVDAEGNRYIKGNPLDSARLERVVNCRFDGYTTIVKDNAIIQGNTITNGDGWANAITINANNVIVSNNNITQSDKSKNKKAIAEGTDKNYNLFIGNICNTAITVNGINTMSVNNINTSSTAPAYASMLPSASTADNGKLLQVVDGAWTAVSITNGNEVAY